MFCTPIFNVTTELGQLVQGNGKNEIMHKFITYLGGRESEEREIAYFYYIPAPTLLYDVITSRGLL